MHIWIFCCPCFWSFWGEGWVRNGRKVAFVEKNVIFLCHSYWSLGGWGYIGIIRVPLSIPCFVQAISVHLHWMECRSESWIAIQGYGQNSSSSTPKWPSPIFWTVQHYASKLMWYILVYHYQTVKSWEWYMGKSCKVFTLSIEWCWVFTLKSFPYFHWNLKMCSVFVQICLAFTLKCCQHLHSKWFSIYTDICSTFTHKLIQYLHWSLLSTYAEIYSMFTLKLVQYLCRNLFNICNEICSAFTLKSVQFLRRNLFSIYTKIYILELSVLNLVSWICKLRVGNENCA